MVLFSTSEPEGACYVETKNLDGETNLKTKGVQKLLMEEVTRGQTRSLPQQMSFLETFQPVIRFESPNTMIYNFEGNVSWVKYE